MADPRIALSATTMIGDSVKNAAGENLGKIEELMVDVDAGRVAYAVLSFGGFLGVGDKLFAVPWSALQLDMENEVFVLNVPKERLEKAPGFDKEDWPDAVSTSDAWLISVYEYYSATPYWQ